MSKLQVVAARAEFIQPLPLAVSDYFRQELEITLATIPVDCSEWAVCENLIYPVLREVAKRYSDHLVVWSHLSLFDNGSLLGVPDYLIAKRSPLGIEVLGTPYGMIIEAKRNDFDAGWGLCLAAMSALQGLNGDPTQLVHGMVSDGFRWDFGKLHSKTLIRHPRSFERV